MSDELAAYRERIDALEAERETLRGSMAKLVANGGGSREENRLASELASIQQRVDQLEARCADGRTGSAAAAWPAARMRVFGAGLLGVLLALAPLAASMATARGDAVWIETTCEARQVHRRGAGSPNWIAIPALRPWWSVDVDSERRGACWIPEPETTHAIARFDGPEGPVSRWAQIGLVPRIASLLLLWVAGIVVLSGRPRARS